MFEIFDTAVSEVSSKNAKSNQFHVTLQKRDTRQPKGPLIFKIDIRFIISFQERVKPRDQLSGM